MSFPNLKKSSFFRKRYGIKKVDQNLLGIKLNFFYVIILNQALVFDQIKQTIIETYYDTLTLETAFHYFWLGFVINNLGELVISICTYSYTLMPLYIIGTRLLCNVIIYLSALKRLPEFQGYLANRFPGQPKPLRPVLLPRREFLKSDLETEWKKNASKRIRTVQIKNYSSKK